MQDLDSLSISHFYVTYYAFYYFIPFLRTLLFLNYF